MRKPKVADPKKKILALLKARAAGKAQYAKADTLLDQLVALVKVNEPVDLGEGRLGKLIDQFEEKTVVWKPCGVRRYDVKIIA